MGAGRGPQEALAAGAGMRRIVLAEEGAREGAAASSAECPIVLVCGFLGPANEHWCRAYWGRATQLGERGSPVVVAPVSCVGSCHDRACELFALLRGERVDYGEEHAAKFGHDRFGKDFSGRGKYPEWSALRPVHLVGHSFGGNTIRALRYLLATDYFGAGTSGAWVRSTTTLSSPLRGSLLTYKLGARENHDPGYPVSRFSPGHLLGLGVHLYELIARPTGLNAVLDFGMSHWGLHRGGLGLFLRSLVIGGHNGGGTPAVCNLDNAAHDMTLPAALEWNEKVQRVMDADPHAYEFNFVADFKLALQFSFRDAKAHLLGPRGDAEAKARQHHSFFYRSLLVMRDFWVSHGARVVHDHTFNLIFAPEVRHDIGEHKSGSDGLCSKMSQSLSGELLDASRLAEEASDLPPGQYTVPLGDSHNHFTIVPLPDHDSLQHEFFQQLFAGLRALRPPPPAPKP